MGKIVSGFSQVCDCIKYLSTFLCFLAISLSVVSLHYSEAIENEGLLLCKVLDPESSECQSSQNEENDNDNETLRGLGELDTLKQFVFQTPRPLSLELPLPDYKNSYLFSFISDFNKPPTLSIKV
jgi:hypothetical protein